MRLLGILNEFQGMNKLLINEYIQSNGKDTFIEKLVLKQKYFHNVFIYLPTEWVNKSCFNQLK
ncbi:hypothetical protein CUC43_14820 [Bacillus thuringiensis LM1212]|nr:hypothetical protein CUC43_14820 [Bacillus thuringiensis LM1212]